MHENQKPAKENILELQERKHLRVGPCLMAVPPFLASIFRELLATSDWVYLAPFPGSTAHSGHSSSGTGTAQHWLAYKENLAFLFVVTTFQREKSRGDGCQLSLLCISMDPTFPSTLPFQINPVNLNNGSGLSGCHYRGWERFHGNRNWYLMNNF